MGEDRGSRDDELAATARSPGGATLTVDGRAQGKRDARASAKSIGRFVIERELGAGGMGVVMLAHDATLDRRVAIKLLRNDAQAGEAARVRMLREAQAMARLRDPNVVTVYEAGTHEGSVYLVMEYVPGSTLRAWCKEPRTWTAVLAKFAAAGRGLAAAHRAELVHRDFKPDNVLVDESGEVKVTDFGLAADGAPDIPLDDTHGPKPDLDALAHLLTKTGEIMGTPRYMAPEQHAAEPTDARSDQFAFCVALYEALYGQHPFGGESYIALCAAVLSGEIAPPPADSDVPARLRDAILRGLSRAPDARFPSMDALLAELAWTPPVRRTKLYAASALGVAALGVAGFFVLRRDHGPTVEEGIAEAHRAALACDCELVRLELPPGATLAGLRDVAGRPLVPLVAQPTGAYAIPRGAHLIEYTAAGTAYPFGIVSRGGATARTVALPAALATDGYAFVAGGEVTIGATTPVTIVLEPYLVARAPLGAPLPYAKALEASRANHARLPTAAEWEWAVRIGAIHVGGTRWEWTATAPGGPPYSVDGDDALAERASSEVRGGGCASSVDCPALATDYRVGRHTGTADVRLARTGQPLAMIALRQVSAHDAADFTDFALAAPELRRLHDFLVRWGEQPVPPGLRVDGTTCEVEHLLEAAGVPAQQIQGFSNSLLYIGSITPKPSPDGRGIVLAFAAPPVLIYPDASPAFRARPHENCGDAKLPKRAPHQLTIVTEPLCFSDDKLLTTAKLDQLVVDLADDPTLHLELHVFAPDDAADPKGVAAARANVLRAYFAKARVAPDRVDITPHGAANNLRYPATVVEQVGIEPAVPQTGCTVATKHVGAFGTCVVDVACGERKLFHGEVTCKYERDAPVHMTGAAGAEGHTRKLDLDLGRGAVTLSSEAPDPISSVRFAIDRARAEKQMETARAVGEEAASGLFVPEPAVVVSCPLDEPEPVGIVRSKR